jgi:hypothetical protein
MTQFPNAMFYDISKSRTDTGLEIVRKELYNSLSTFERIYFIMTYNTNSISLLDGAYIYHQKDMEDKLTILLHNTPTLLDVNILNTCTVLGSFSSHEESYSIDFDILSGQNFLDNTINKLPINLDAKGLSSDSKYTIDESYFKQFQIDNGKYKLITYYSSRREKTLADKNDSLTEKNSILETENNTLRNEHLSIKNNIKSLTIEIIVIVVVIGIIIIGFLVLFFRIFVSTNKGESLEQKKEFKPINLQRLIFLVFFAVITFF